ncbi:MAG: hypothetical protein LBV78_23310 [Kitasatospora sp.]|nr:hypothetical protein [Kitasatospora sp.]
MIFSRLAAVALACADAAWAAATLASAAGRTVGNTAPTSADATQAASHRTRR